MRFFLVCECACACVYIYTPINEYNYFDATTRGRSIKQLLAKRHVSYDVFIEKKKKNKEERPFCLKNFYSFVIGIGKNIELRMMFQTNTVILLQMIRIMRLLNKRFNFI